MPFEVISTNQNSTYTAHSFDKVILLQGVNVSVSGKGISAGHNDPVDIVVHGTITTALAGVDIGLSASDTSEVNVHVSATGTITGVWSGTAAIFLRRDGTEVINDGALVSGNTGVGYTEGVQSGYLDTSGTIKAGFIGVDFQGSSLNAVAGTFTMLNSGLVSAQFHGVLADDEDLELFNSGTIMAGNTGVLFQQNPTNSNSLLLRNTGTVQGFEKSVQSGDTVDTVVNRGLLDGDVELGGGVDKLRNTGDVLGDVRTGDGSDTVTNKGRIDGDIDTGGVGDTVRNSGTVLGEIKLGGGGDFYDGRGGVAEAVDGGNGDDVFQSDAYMAVLKGGAGQDLAGLYNSAVLSQIEEVRMLGQRDISVLMGKSTVDSEVFGNSGNNVVQADLGSDTLRGRGGRDQLLGGDGDDALLGGRDADVLTGEAGSDSLIGGAGNDSFVLEDIAHSGLGGDSDRIIDFGRGNDVIDLSGLSKGRIAFLGTSAFTASGDAEIRYSTNASGEANVRIDLDGDGSADGRIVVENTASLNAGDFIL